MAARVDVGLGVSVCVGSGVSVRVGSGVYVEVGRSVGVHVGGALVEVTEGVGVRQAVWDGQRNAQYEVGVAPT